MRTRVLLLLVVLVAGACSSFGASEPTPDGGASDSAAADAREPGPGTDAAPVDASAALGPDASDCDAGCVLFSDDFERPTGMVKGAWTELEGSPKLISAGAGYGTVFQGGFGTARTGATFREELLSKDLPVGSGLRVSAKIQLQIFADGGAFGSNALDYCEFMSVRLGEQRIALLYVDTDHVVQSWLYGPDETPGSGATFTTSLDTWADVEIALRWTATDVTMKTTVGAASDERTEPLAGGAGGLTPSLRIGMRCTGTTPAISSFTDAVVVRAIP